MEILSPVFAGFAFVVLLGNRLLAQNARKPWLLLASYVFLGSWSIRAAALLAVLTLLNFFIAQRMERSPRPGSWFWAGLLLNGGGFFCLKLITSPLALFLAGRAGFSNAAAWIMPIGFSFYILQMIGYLLDVRAGQLTASRSLLDFSLYLAYFPKLLAGPLERSSKFLAQLSPLAAVDAPAVRRGLALILMGLLRKVVIADTLLWLVPSDFSQFQSGSYSFLERTGWVLVFAFRLYNDFAGYTDIMRGISLLLGIQLSPNFRQPFAARTLSDFWNRWHISLSGWLRDNIFFPLSRAMARRHWGAGWLRLLLPPLVTMLFSGFWHGATLAMLVWGGLHGLGLVFEQLGQRWSDRLPGWVGRLFFAPSLARTFAGTTFLWVLFAAGDLSWALDFYRSLLPPYTALAPVAGWLWPLVIIAFSVGVDWVEDHQFLARASDLLKALAIGAALVLVLLSIQTGQDVSGFVYQGF